MAVNIMTSILLLDTLNVLDKLIYNTKLLFCMYRSYSGHISSGGERKYRASSLGNINLGK